MASLQNVLTTANVIIGQGYATTLAAPAWCGQLDYKRQQEREAYSKMLADHMDNSLFNAIMSRPYEWERMTASDIARGACASAKPAPSRLLLLCHKP